MVEKIKIGITTGDPNGIGYEVIIKALSDSRLCELFTPIVYGSAKQWNQHRKLLAEVENLTINSIKEAEEAHGARVNLIGCVDDNLVLAVGQSTPEGGQGAFAALERAVSDLKAGKIDVLVTAPINKQNIQSDSFHFTGHTEYLAAAFEGGDPLMMMVNEVMRVGLVTIHIPLSEVTPHITTENIVRKLKLFKNSLIGDFGLVNPRIAVLGLNPHAGDGGFLGTEEVEIITPAVHAANQAGVLAFGPFAADGFFGSGNYKKYDGVLAMYHDQGLAPFKALSEEMSVNFTAGLSVVRTSPAHGVGYDIAGQDVADPSSFRSALYLAVDIWRHRRNYKKMTRNPLRKTQVEKGPDVSVKDLPEAN